MPMPPLAPPNSLWERVRGFFRTLLFTAFLFSTLFIFNGIQILSLVIFPISPKLFRAINRWGANTWWGFVTLLAAGYYGTHIELSGDDLPPLEHVILLANHQQMADITFLMFLGRKLGRLGDMKWFVKDIVKWVPGIGWGMLFLDCFFVKRDWAKDQNSIGQTFARILKNKIPLWLTMFPEGTRLSPAKIASSQAYAEKTKQPGLSHLLIPRSKGFVASVQGLRQHLHAVYDVSIGYKQGVPSLWQYVGGFGREAFLHVRRFPIAELPEDSEALSHWLQQRWAEKDQLLEQFYLTGAFPADSQA